MGVVIYRLLLELSHAPHELVDAIRCMDDAISFVYGR